MRTNDRAARRGSTAVEVLLFLPLILGIVLALVQLSMMITGQHMLAGASREGARVAATGGDEQEVERAIRRFLGEGRLSCATVEVECAVRHGEPVAVTVRIPTDRAAPNMLAFLGVCPPEKYLCARTVMRKE